MTARVRFTGGKELERALLELGRKEALKLGRAALRKAARQVANAAKAAVPVREGRLKRSIEVKVDQRFVHGQGRLPVLDAKVRVSGKLGERPRKTDRRSRIRGKLQEAKYGYQIGSWPNVYGAFLEFGTAEMTPRPFLRPAWDSEGGQTALDRIGKELGGGLEKAAAGMPKGR